MYLGAISPEHLNQMEAETRQACGEAEGHFPLLPIVLGGAIGALMKPAHRSDGAMTGALYGLIAAVVLKATVSYGCRYLPNKIAEIRRRGGV